MTSTNQLQIDKYYMDMALELAQQAHTMNEVPVGALVVLNEQVIGKAHNRCIADTDPSAHAEVLALRQAAASINNFRLDGATLYVTLEPCLMCCGTLLQSRIARLVYGAREPRTGGVVSVHESLRLPGIDHHVAISEGILAEESAAMLRSFFEKRR